jgi:heme-degrading monooxygenase HmoA
VTDNAATPASHATSLYSLTVWTVEPGEEDEFVRHWKEFADWSAAEGLAAKATLLRDVDVPGRFVSFGPWETLEAIRRWRALPDHREHVAALSEHVSHIEPCTLEVITEH